MRSMERSRNGKLPDCKNNPSNDYRLSRLRVAVAAGRGGSDTRLRVRRVSGLPPQGAGRVLLPLSQPGAGGRDSTLERAVRLAPACDAEVPRTAERRIQLRRRVGD